MCSFLFSFGGFYWEWLIFVSHCFFFLKPFSPIFLFNFIIFVQPDLDIVPVQ